jgi:hypothetical protein
MCVTVQGLPAAQNWDCLLEPQLSSNHIDNPLVIIDPLVISPKARHNLSRKPVGAGILMLMLIAFAWAYPDRALDDVVAAKYQAGMVGRWEWKARSSTPVSAP